MLDIRTLHLQSLTDSAMAPVGLSVLWDGFADRRDRPSIEHLAQGGFRQAITIPDARHEYAIPVTFVPSATATLVDRWWARGDRIRLVINSADTIPSSRLQIDTNWLNLTAPLVRRVHPYDDQWTGVLVLRAEAAADPTLRDDGLRFTLSSSDYGRLSVHRLG